MKDFKNELIFILILAVFFLLFLNKCSNDKVDAARAEANHKIDSIETEIKFYDVIADSLEKINDSLDVALDIEKERHNKIIIKYEKAKLDILRFDADSSISLLSKNLSE
jgi:hypothetical protein